MNIGMRRMGRGERRIEKRREEERRKYRSEEYRKV
jgi:hypothetical protein